MSRFALLCSAALLFGCAHQPEPVWHTTFFDDFDAFDTKNWQDQRLWVNGEKQCYVPDNQYDTREVSNGTLKLRVVNIGRDIECDNVDKFGNVHPPTRYVAGRIASKNLKEFSGGRWTARLRLHGNGQPGMFPAWWLLGARNNEPPVQEADEDICWPMPGSGEIDIFEHFGSGGANHYAARKIKHHNNCDGGDWESLMKVITAELDQYHEYSVEWLDGDLVYRLDGIEVHRNPGEASTIQEPLFAILNYAKIDDSPIEGTWTMEVDWVKHERFTSGQ